MSEKECCPPARSSVVVPVSDEEFNVRFAELSKALGHPARIAILRILLKRESCICGEIVEELPLAQSTVSQHLRQLKAAGWIRGEVDGPRVCYCIEPATLDLFQELVSVLSAMKGC
jgi:ArsR family transcriptional regulator